jgi:hypothetical protein
MTSMLGHHGNIGRSFATQTANPSKVARARCLLPAGCRAQSDAGHRSVGQQFCGGGRACYQVSAQNLARFLTDRSCLQYRSVRNRNHCCGRLATLVFRPGEGGNAVTGSRKKGLWLAQRPLQWNAFARCKDGPRHPGYGTSASFSSRPSFWVSPWFFWPPSWPFSAELSWPL